MSKQTKTILVFLSLLLYPSLIHADSINLTTYYPAPFGSYSRLQLLPQAAPTCAAGQEGLLYIDSTTFELRVCNGAGFEGVSPWTEVSTTSPKTVYATDTIADAAYKVGVGVIPTANSMKLHLAQDGGILADGAFGSGAAVGNPGAGTRLLWYPAKGAFRAGGIDSTQWNDANIGNYSVAFGYNTKASRDYATISGGSGNVNQSFNGVFGVDAQYSVVGGGLNNMMSTYGSTIGGGEGNGTLRAGLWYNGYFGAYQTIAGGFNNKVESTLATIGGGVNNLNLGGFSTIAGGNANIIGDGVSGDFTAFIGGGENNRVSGFYGTISGGRNNTTTNTFGNWANVVGGGDSNTASGSLTTVGGGGSNSATGGNDTVAGGNNNHSTGGSSFVGGGTSNTAGGGVSTISGGSSNTASGGSSSIGGGSTNTASGSQSTVGGGSTNTAGGRRDTVSGGFQNNATTPPSGFPSTEWAATIAGGSDNIVSHGFSTVGGGRANTASGIYATVPGGQNNIAGADYSFAAGRNTQLSNAASGTFAWGNSGAASSVTIPNSFVIFPANEGNALIGTAANASAVAPAGTYSDVKLFVNGPIGGNLERANPGSYGELQVDCTTTPGKCYAVYAP